MEIKTSELTGAALDWAVAKAIGSELVEHQGDDLRVEICPGLAAHWSPSTSWSQCGPLIDAHGIEFKWVTDATIEAYSYTLSENRVFGQSHLQAACLLLAYELGDTVDVPEELLG